MDRTKSRQWESTLFCFKFYLVVLTIGSKNGDSCVLTKVEGALFQSYIYKRVKSPVPELLFQSNIYKVHYYGIFTNGMFVKLKMKIICNKT